MSIPTLMVFKNGQLVKQNMGAMPKAKILDMVE
jgi:thioredoxin-like negative regulator of GroEL